MVLRRIDWHNMVTNAVSTAYVLPSLSNNKNADIVLSSTQASGVITDRRSALLKVISAQEILSGIGP